jgi:fructoselysine 6-kinase
MNKILALSCCCVDVFPEKDEIHVGGNALNLASNCVKTGKAEVYLTGTVGTDIYAQKIRECADKHGINHERLYGIEGETASNKVYLTSDGDRYFKDDSWTNGVIRDFEISNEDEEFIKSCDAVATTLNDGLMKELCGIRLNSDFILSIDFMEHDLLENQAKWQEYLPALDLFFISGKREYLPILKKLSCEYSTVFVATLGKDGSVAFKDGVEYSCEAVRIPNVVDTTGCGDSYQGAFIVEYLESGDIASSMKAGANSAAVTLSFMGAVAP